MACCPTKSYGYESCRFEKDVDENFHCSICYNVLKEPRMCRNNEHMFCLDCITEHLEVNSRTCPECNEHLSVDTLRRPRVVNNYLSELKINCDYAIRGCPENVRVADLKSHVENCCFAPVFCSNEECGMEINKQDKVHHETEICEYRKVKRHECGQIQEVVGRLEENVMELNKKVEVVKEMNKRISEKVEAARAETSHEIEVVNKEVKEVKKEVKEKVEAARKETRNEVEEVKKEVKAVSKDVHEVKVMMIQILEKLNMLELLNKLPSPSEGMMSTPREDILIAGGNGSLLNIEKSAEIYSWEKSGWFEMSELNEGRRGASSFIFKGRLFVVGGQHSDTIETLDLNELPLKWMKFLGELPNKCDDHQTVVYQQRIIHIGGFNYLKIEMSNVISELQLSSPYIMKELCHMPERRQRHGAEIIEDKVLIMGGDNDDGTLDGVLEFDIMRNKYKEMPPLPHALRNMATVRWRDTVVLLGGQDKDSNVLNDVFMYDCKTGKTTALPSLLEKRCGCCAVITGNTIVVMGGRNDKGDGLDSVECFTMGGSTWEYLPAMNKARNRAIAEVLPSTRKYV